MRIQEMLSKIYGSCLSIILSVMLLTCLWFKWPFAMIVLVMMASAVISAPSIISLQVMIWLSGKIKFETGFVWMVLLASIPLLSFIAAVLFADYVPGKVWFLLLFGMLSSYAAVLSHGISVTELFYSTQDEREENNTID